MKTSEATKTFAALAHDKRLAVFRLLVRAGKAGVAATDIALRLKIQPATLSFHLKELAAAGLVNARQDGRFIFYSANYATMDRMMKFLTDNCCDGAGCEIAAPAARSRSARA